MAAVVAALLLQTGSPALPASGSAALRASAVETAGEERVRVLPPILHAAGLLTTMRVSEALLWPRPFADFRGASLAEHYREAYTRPPLFDASARPFEWDHDRWFINVIGHGLLGSELHLRARQCAFGVVTAVAFTAAASATWEYLIEASGVRPSALDLVYTPLAGLVLGEARLLLYRAARGIDPVTLRGVVRALVDPFGELERGLGSGC